MRKFSVCTVTDLNPRFGGPWDMLWTFLDNASKEVLFFEFHTRVQMCITKIKGLSMFYKTNLTIRFTNANLSSKKNRSTYINTSTMFTL